MLSPSLPPGGDAHPNGLRYGATAMQGWRVKMEDAHVAQICLNENEAGREGGMEDEGGREGRLALFGVFDGHRRG